VTLGLFSHLIVSCYLMDVTSGLLLHLMVPCSLRRVGDFKTVDTPDGALFFESCS
jgi:hypothetical protein